MMLSRSFWTVGLKRLGVEHADIYWIHNPANEDIHNLEAAAKENEVEIRDGWEKPMN
jgi:aryl-alcohol dehydrogenase-like predicted oxidoreductase